MQFRLGFDPERAQQFGLGIAPPLPAKCTQGYWICDFPHFPGYVMAVIPASDESEFACAMEVELVSQCAAERDPVESRKRGVELALYDAVSATSPFPVKIIPPKARANQGAHS